MEQFVNAPSIKANNRKDLPSHGGQGVRLPRRKSRKSPLKERLIVVGKWYLSNQWLIKCLIAMYLLGRFYWRCLGHVVRLGHCSSVRKKCRTLSACRRGERRICTGKLPLENHCRRIVSASDPRLRSTHSVFAKDIARDQREKSMCTKGFR